MKVVAQKGKSRMQKTTKGIALGNERRACYYKRLCKYLRARRSQRYGRAWNNGGKGIYRSTYA